MNTPFLQDLKPGLKVLLLFSFFLFSAVLFGMLSVQLIELIWGIDMMTIEVEKIDVSQYDDYRAAFQLSNFLNQIGAHLIAALTFFQLSQKSGLGFSRFSIKPKMKLVSLMVLLGASCLLGGMVVNMVNDWIVGDVLNMQRVVDDASEHYSSIQSILLGGGNSAMLINIVLLGLIAPICEEVFYRAGVTQLLLRTFPNKFAALVLSGLIFSIMHFEFNGFLLRFMMGLGLAWVFYKTGTIWAGLILHATYNVLGVLLEYGFNGGVFDESVTPIIYVGLLFTIPLIVIIKRSYKAPAWPIEVPELPIEEEDLEE